MIIELLLDFRLLRCCEKFLNFNSQWDSNPFQITQQVYSEWSKQQTNSSGRLGVESV